MNSPLDVRREGRVLVLTMNDPATRNALQPGVYTAGAEALRAANSDPDLGAIILTGANGAFCSGGDVRRLKSYGDQPVEVQRAGVDAFHGFVRLLRTVDLPVIAAVEGPAAGAGFSLAMACDMVVASREAWFVMAYVKVGLNPDGGASAFLSRGLPHQVVAEILFNGDVIAVERLHALGCINRLTEPGQALPEAMAWAERLSTGPRAALARAKRLVEGARQNALAQQLDLEADLFTEASRHPEAAEGMAAFLEKRAPDFTRGR